MFKYLIQETWCIDGKHLRLVSYLLYNGRPIRMGVVVLRPECIPELDDTRKGIIRRLKVWKDYYEANPGDVAAAIHKMRNVNIHRKSGKKDAPGRRTKPKQENQSRSNSMSTDKLGAKESINKMSFAALALAEVMLDLLDKAHAEKPEAGYDKQKAKMQQLIAELKFYTEEE